MITNTKEAFEILRANVDGYMIKSITHECIDYIEKELKSCQNALKELTAEQDRAFNERREHETN